MRGLQERSLAIPDRERVLALRRDRVQNVGDGPRLLAVDTGERVEGVLFRVKDFRQRDLRYLVIYKKARLWRSDFLCESDLELGHGRVPRQVERERCTRCLLVPRRGKKEPPDLILPHSECVRAAALT